MYKINEGKQRKYKRRWNIIVQEEKYKRTWKKI